MTKEKKDKKDIKISELKEQCTTLENNWKRALADYQNLQKRVSEERIEFVKFANQTLLLKLIYLLDNLELVQKHSEDKGLEMIVKEFERVLQEENVTEIKALDADFNENTMEAVETKKGKKGKVLEVTQKGYLFNEKVLRPARVVVGAGEERKE